MESGGSSVQCSVLEGVEYLKALIVDKSALLILSSSHFRADFFDVM